MNDDQLRLITERLDQVQKVADRIDRDLGHDRHDLQEFALRLGAIEGEVRQLKDGLNRLPVRVADKVEDVVEPAQKEVRDLKQTIDRKRYIRISIDPFWKRWFRNL